ncbi:DUF3560 domain-containing protein [Nocardia bovistercoris]|uniref:DUF3560 domain-containing protein n=1 Tax=Nocardia bovistercoris TaxID=2785916 RepID=A0A931N1U3_9NOCA|nr:DUF3560 domain-containing protein [Nocardia bovistercoris]MBH0778790.1 DUF3560 domain-containing protein [Nocardia bovistercoris]
MSLTIRHTAETGTLLDGTGRGDGTYEVMTEVRKRVGHWKWFRSMGQWGLVSSRDRQPKDYCINAAAEALRAAGFTVALEIDRAHRPAAEAEADRAARQEDRVDALDAKADRRAAKATAADEASRRAHESLPEWGEPVKIGHHSENRHRRSLERAWNAMGRSVEAHRDADVAAQRAEAARHTTDYRHSPVTVANRIDKFEAEQRGDQRILDGGERGRPPYVTIDKPASGAYREKVIARMAQRADEIQHWKDVRAAQIADGLTLGLTKADVAKGDAVKVRGEWYRVVRANAKTVTVESRFIAGHNGTVPYQEISAHRKAADPTEAKA